jgi:hypothetical protein
VLATRSILGRFVLPLTLLLLLAAPKPSLAEWGPGTYMLQAVGQLMSAILQISEKTEYGYDDGIAIMAAYLDPGETVAFIRTIERGQKYAVVGGGDNDVRDLDIEVTDEDGRMIASDTKDDNQPVVLFTASYSGKIVIRQKLFAAARGSFCVVAILRAGGWRVPKENLIKSAAGVISGANRVDQNVSGRVGFQSGQNQWAMYGGVFRRGDQIDITHVGLGTGRRVILAAGDTQSKDIDLYVSVGNDEVKDVDPDANPIVDFTATNVSSATIRIKNADSIGPSLILTTILQIE